MFHGQYNIAGDQVAITRTGTVAGPLSDIFAIPREEAIGYNSSLVTPQQQVAEVVQDYRSNTLTVSNREALATIGVDTGYVDYKQKEYTFPFTNNSGTPVEMQEQFFNLSPASQSSTTQDGRLGLQLGGESSHYPTASTNKINNVASIIAAAGNNPVVPVQPQSSCTIC